MNFGNPASVKEKEEVTVEEESRVNVGGPTVTFYMGDGINDADFTVKVNNSQVTANIIIPNGKLKTEGSDRPS